MKRLLALLAAAAACSAAGAQTARVIVTFKDDSTTVRAQALAAGDSRERVAQALRGRAQTLAARHGVAMGAGIAISSRTQVVTAEGMTSEALAAKLAADGEVASVEIDRRARALAVAPDDAFYGSVSGSQGPAVGQWYLRAPDPVVVAGIDAPTAWSISQGGAPGQGVVVAVLDTGVRYDHPDLAGKLLTGLDAVSDSRFSNDGDGVDSDASDPGDFVTKSEAATSAFINAGCKESDSSWHGTQIAGLVGAATNNGVGIAGVGWNVRVLPVRVLGKCGGAVSDIAAAIRWAAGLAVPGYPSNPTPAKVINLSLGGSGSCGSTYQNAINEAVAAGVTVVAAAGNDTGLAVNAPGNCQNVVTVAGVRHVGTKVGYSNVGPQVTLAAPGGNCVNIAPDSACLYPIMSTFNDGATTPGTSSYTDSYRAAVGTSFSTPIVAGTIGLMIAAQPGITPEAVKAMLQQTARPFPTTGGGDGSSVVAQCHAPNGVTQDQCYCTTSTCGAGMLNAGAAVTLAQASPPVAIVPAVTVTETPTAGQTVTVSAAGSSVGGNRTLTITWSIVDGDGIVSSLTTTTGPTTSFVATGSGTVVLRATLTDNAGYTETSDQTITVKSSSGGGGGAMSAAWLALLGAAAVALRRRPSARH